VTPVATKIKAVIVDGLMPLASPIDNLTPDPQNARRGDVAAIRRSLNVFGQRKPVIVRQTGTDAEGRPTGIVMAGNHTLSAAAELGWDHVAAIFVSDDATTAKAYALADNRTAELASWDTEQLTATLRELGADDFEMDALGWSPDDLAKLLHEDRGGEEPDPPSDFPVYDEDIATDHTCPACGYRWSGGK
jgi:ParB-like chromosome segregation protein Spo0J